MCPGHYAMIFVSQASSQPTSRKTGKEERTENLASRQNAKFNAKGVNLDSIQ